MFVYKIKQSPKALTGCSMANCQKVNKFHGRLNGFLYSMVHQMIDLIDLTKLYDVMNIVSTIEYPKNPFNLP